MSSIAMRRLTAGPSVRLKLRVAENEGIWMVDTDRAIVVHEGVEEPDKVFLLYQTCR